MSHIRPYKESKISYTREVLLFFSELDTCKEFPSGFDRSILRESKTSYTREFLLSFSELDTCKELPSGFDRSILRPCRESKISYTREFFISFSQLETSKELPSDFGRPILQESKISYTREFLLSFNELDTCKELPSEFDQSILWSCRESKISYTREFLFSFSELDTCKELTSKFDQSILCELDICKELPSEFDRSIQRELDICKSLPRGFNPSILRDFSDTSNNILEKRRTPGSVSSYSSRRSEYSSSPSTTWDLGNHSREYCGKRISHSPGLNNRDSHIQGNCDSDAGRHHNYQSQSSWKNPEHDGLLGNGALPRVSGCMAEALEANVQENGHYQLSKSDNPYRPPHSYKAVLNSRRESSNSSTEPLNEKRAEEKKRRRASFELISKQQQKVTREKEKQIGCMDKENLDPVIATVLKDCGNDKRLASESEECVILAGSNNSLDKSSFPTQNLTLVIPCFNGILENNLGIKSSTPPYMAEHADAEADKNHKTEKPILYSSKFERWFEEEKKPASGSSSVSMKGAYGGSNKLFTEYNYPIFSSNRSKLMCKLMTSTSTSATDGIPEQLFGSKSAINQGILTYEDLEQSIVSDINENSVNQHHSTQGPGVSDLGNEQPNYANDNGESLTFFSLFQPTEFSKLKMLSSKEMCTFKTESHSTMFNFSTKGKTQQSGKKGTLEPVSGMCFMNQSNELCVSVQRGLVNKVSRTDVSEPRGFPFPVTDDILYASVAHDCGFIGTNYEGIKATNFGDKIELDRMKVNQSAFDDDWAEIMSILQKEQEPELCPVAGCYERPDSTDEILWPDKDSLIAIDDSIIPQHSNLEIEIASNIQTQQELKLCPVTGCNERADSTDEILWPKEDSLIAIDDSISPQHSNLETEIASNIQTKQELKLSTVAGYDEIADSTGELCLPDEDSLITIDDLIIPQHSVSMPGCSESLQADKLTSYGTTDIADNLAAVNVTHCDERYTVPGMGRLPFLFGSHDMMGSESHLHNMDLQQSNPEFHHPHLNPGRPSFHLLDSQTNFIDAKSVHCNLPFHLCFCPNSHLRPSWKTPPAKPRSFNHTVQYSLLQQPMAFIHQQNELQRGAALPNPIYKMACCTQDVNPMQIPILNSRQPIHVGFGIPNPDPRGVAGKQQDESGSKADAFFRHSWPW